MNPDKYLPYLKLLGVVVIALVIAYYIGSRTGKAKKENEAEDQLKKEIDRAALTYEQTQYSALADDLEAAMYGFRDNENTVYAVMAKMRNRSDLLQLIKSFGMRRIIWTWGNSNLNAWINNRLDTAEIAQVNDILARNSIDYQF